MWNNFLHLAPTVSDQVVLLLLCFFCLLSVSSCSGPTQTQCKRGSYATTGIPTSSPRERHYRQPSPQHFAGSWSSQECGDSEDAPGLVSGQRERAQFHWQTALAFGLEFSQPGCGCGAILGEAISSCHHS